MPAQPNALSQTAGTSGVANRCYAILASLGLRSNGSAWRRVVLASLRSDIVQHELRQAEPLYDSKIRTSTLLNLFFY